MAIVIKRRPEAGQRFPFIALPRAIDRARELYKVANGHDVPFATAVTAWGYAEKSSGGAQTAAALKSFGLLDDVAGSDVRKVKLTDSALRIIRDPRDISPDRDALIRQAALRPPLHREILEKYSGMPPSDEALKAFLLMDRGLKDEAVPEFIREFAATMAFAKIAEQATIQDMEAESEAIERRVDALGAGESDGSAGTPPVARKLAELARGGAQRAPAQHLETPPNQRSDGGRLMTGERELTTGLLSRDASFRLIVTGKIGAREIDRLIRKLEFDKEILAETDDGAEPESN